MVVLVGYLVIGMRTMKTDGLLLKRMYTMLKIF